MRHVIGNERLGAFTEKEHREGRHEGVSAGSEQRLLFAALKGKELTACFDEPKVSSDGGVLLLREVERQVGVVGRLAEAVVDERRQSHIDHEIAELLSQRIFQVACGYEDADDCDELRRDPAFKAAVGRDPQDDPDLGSQPTMSRLENAVGVRDLLRMGYALVDQFIASYETPPQLIVLDMDPTADTVHGHQQLRLFNAYEDEYCFMPFHIYEGISGRLIATILRAGKTPTDKEIISCLKRIVKRIRREWPETVIMLRADSHHTKPEVMSWMESKGVEYVTGLTPNKKLNELFSLTIEDAEKRYKRFGGKICCYASGFYAAGTWKEARRVICRVLVSDKGTDVRYIVTSFEATGAKYLYTVVYCGRGNMELMIKDHKVGLKSDRTSCHRKEGNQFRLLLHSAAYVLLHALRERVLSETELARAQFDTIRLKLLKIGARFDVLKTAIRVHLPDSYPLKPVLHRATAVLTTIDTT
jgi:hypothetical protein